ncbi:MAG: hypothetical protein ACKV22_39510 [Bryobacteraceae bacterium]
MKTVKRRRESGNIMMEFALTSVIAVPMMLGIIWGGLTIGRGIQSSQVARDTAHMFAKGVDFSSENCVSGDVTSCNQHLIVRLAYGTGMTLTGGNGVVVLSKIGKVYQADCDAAALTGSQCVNKDHTVFTWRTTVGNASLRASNFGTPSANLVNPDGTVKDQLIDTGAQANNFDPVLSLAYGDVAYVVECYLQTADLWGGQRGTYSYAVF